MNIKRIAFLTLGFFIFHANYSVGQQNWLWSAGGAGNDEALDNAVDPYGNVFTLGYFSLSAKFDTTVFTSAGSGDIFISKQNYFGQYIWTVKAGGASSDRGYSISTDSYGNVYVTGFYSGLAVFGPDTLRSVNGSIDVFVTKVDSSGHFMWTKSFGGADIDIGLDLYVDFPGNLFVTGQFRGTATFGTSLFKSLKDSTGASSYDIFILKLDTAGNVVWAKQGGGKYDDRGLAITGDESGNIYFTGQYSDTLFMGATYPNVAHGISFICKLDSSGSIRWMHTLLATQVLAHNIQCFNNDIYISGDFRGQLAIVGKTTLNLKKPYSYKIFAARLDSSGTAIWAVCDGSDNPVSAQAMAIDHEGNAYLAGTFNCIMSEYSALYGTGIFNSVGYRDVFIAKYNTGQGTRQYVRQFGGPGDDLCRAISVLTFDHPIIAGSFETYFNVPGGGSFSWNHTNLDPSSSGPSQPSPYCDDYNYRRYTGIHSYGNKDIFSSSPLDLTRSPYDYFDRSGADCVRDSLLPSINNGKDTIIACDKTDLFVTRHTGSDGVVGPAYEYLWSTGETEDRITVTDNGWYSLAMRKKDNCRSYSDSVFVMIFSSPPQPLIAATKGTIREAIPVQGCNTRNQTLIVIMPDTATLYCTNAPPGYSTTWSTPFGVFSGDSVKTWTGGNYMVTVSSPEGGCSRSECISVIVYIIGSSGNCIPADFEPEIHFLDKKFEQTDTVRLCQHEYFDMVLINGPDWALGYTLDFIPAYVDWTFNGGFIFSPPKSFHTTFGYHRQSFQAEHTGNCSVTASIEDPVFGGVIASVTRSFYLVVYPLPPLEGKWHGPEYICPGDTALLTLTGGSTYEIAPADGIVYISPHMDSILVVHEGRYSCSYTVVDPVTGCSSAGGVSFDLKAHAAPHISMQPANGLICPSDSVQLVAEKGTNYVWTGPLGFAIGTNKTVYVSSPGDYHYDFTDTSGCRLISETVEVKNYSTPYLVADPQAILCRGGSVKINIQTNDSSGVLWQSPLSGTDPVQTVDSPGTYTCSITSCGITTTASFVITLDTPSVQIAMPVDSVICVGDTALLTASPGMAAYDWEPGGWGLQSLYATLAATYTLTVSDIYGCTASATATIDTLRTPSVPSTSGAKICYGDSVTLVASANNRIDWYASFYGASIDSDSVYITPRLYHDTVFYVTTYNSICHSIKVEVPVNINPASLSPPIFGAYAICTYDSLFLFTNPIPGGIYEWSGPNSFTSALESFSVNPVDSSHAGYYYLHIADSMCSSPVDSIRVRVSASTAIQIASSKTTFCAGESDTLYAMQSLVEYYWLPGGKSDTLLIAHSSGSYSLIATDINGCLDTSQTITLTVVPLPPAPIVNDTGICLGRSVALTSVSSNTTNWYNNLVALLFTGNTFITPVLNDSAVYYIQQVDTGGCKSPFDTVIVHVTPIPPVPVLTGDTLYCEGLTIHIAADNVSDTIYHWSGPNSFNDSNQNLSISNCTAGETGAYTFFVSASGCVDSAAVHITVFPVPSNMIYSNAPVCAGNSIAFSTDTNATLQYNWHGPLGFSSFYSSDSIINATVAQSGYYTLEVKNPACGSGMDSVYFKVASYPSFKLGNDTVVCPGSPLTLNVDTGYDAYDWSNGFNSNAITVTDSGEYFVKVTNSPSCSLSDTIRIDVIGCTPFIPNVFTPNRDGVNDYFYVTYKGAKDISIIILNRWGGTVRQLNADNLRWDGTNDAGKEVPGGTYYYIVNATNYFDKHEEFRGFVELIR